MIDKDQLMKFHLESVELGFPTLDLKHEINRIVDCAEKLFRYSPDIQLHILEARYWSYLKFKKYENGDIFEFYINMAKWGIYRSIKYRGRILKLKTFLDII